MLKGRNEYLAPKGLKTIKVFHERKKINNTKIFIFTYYNNLLIILVPI